MEQVLRLTCWSVRFMLR